MAIVADVFSGLLAFVFGSAAIAKLVRQTQQLETAAKLQIPWHRYRWIGVPEAAGFIGLVIGYASDAFGAAAGIGLAFLMAGALFFRLRIHDSAGYLLGDAALLGLAAATAALRITTSS
jgi:DoxX-like protein